jgi:hypothetical protein
MASASAHLASPTERDPEQIRAEIDRTRAELAATVAQLSAEVTARADWREWVRRRPVLFVGGAFALGLWLAERG